MKYIGYTLLLLIAVMAYSFRPSGKSRAVTPSKNVISKEFTFDKFDKLDVSSAIKVNYVQSTGTPKVVVTAPDNLIDRIEVTEVNGKLTIGYKKNTVITTGKMTGNWKAVVEIQAPALTDIELSGASSFKAESLYTKDVSVELSGASTFNVENIIADKADFELSGASTVKSTNAQIRITDFDLSGASTLKINKYSGDSGSIDLSGASTIDIAGNVENIELNASGASNAKLVNLQATSGTVCVTGASKARTNIKKLSKVKSSGSSTVSNEK